MGKLGRGRIEGEGGDDFDESFLYDYWESWLAISVESLIGCGRRSHRGLRVNGGEI